MHPKDFSIADYNYVLPPDRIAQEPLSQRDHSKLLVYNNGAMEEDLFCNLLNYLPENATLVFNDTKVIHARIIFKNENGANIEVFLLEPMEPVRDMQLAMFLHGACTWRCMVGNVKKWREKVLCRKIKIGDKAATLEACMREKGEDDFVIDFSWKPETVSFAQVLEAAGNVPLPPYIRRNAGTEDQDRYQTLYAFQDGSVAAPTAGLHFTESLFKKFTGKNIYSLFLTLHVSAGTFRPVKAQTLKDHRMHEEQFVIRKMVLEELINKKTPLVAVGTTSLRTLESLYWLGLKLLKGDESLIVDQWMPYESIMSITTADSMEAILNFMEKKELTQLIAETKLLIAPGYAFKLTDALITNFHMPRSTLLLLVSAFIGDDWKKVYEYALKNNFRFLSYGDASLMWRSVEH
ncbi:MAG: S-adenosylmethionine:tRNA ribosyltransferase-isomerase [Chitinophagales bacterium]|nr:S-adenosylmethionine:tRNA ribosyltransferase-isomerase [Chitinophagales bacterium]